MNVFAPKLVSSNAFYDGDSGGRSPTAALDTSIDDYLRRVEAKPGFARSLEHIQRQNIVFVSSGMARSSGDLGTPVVNKTASGNASSPSLVWFILRRVDESTRQSVLLYLVLKEAKILYQVSLPIS